MTRNEMNIRAEKDKNRIEKLEDILKKAVAKLKEQEDEILGLNISLQSARMFATALMIVTNTESAEFTREELQDITENKMIGFSEVKNDAGETIGVKLELKVEVINETKEVVDIEAGRKRTRKPSKRNADRSKDTVQAGNDGLDEPPTDERLN